ncbi:MAG: glycosyltransferase [Tsuneonella suprasediminis]|nr:glycosyltransferase [Altererythrobacter sp. N1]
MRILHIATNFERLAGAEQALINLLNSGLGENNMVVSLRSRALADKVSLPDGCRIESLSLPHISVAQAAKKLRALAAEFQPDVLIGWMYHGNAAASLLRLTSQRGCPVVWTVHHALDDLRSESRSTKLAIAGSAMLSRRADAIVYVSQRAFDQHKRLFGNPKCSVIIPNAIQIGAAASVGRHSHSRTVGFAARYHPTKDFPLFLKVVHDIHASDPTVRFIACGEGASGDNPQLAQLMKNAGVTPGEIEWLGPQRNMATFYKSLDLFVMTSRSEGFGMVLAEALSHGVPCVSTDVGAAREIIAEFGKVVPVGDAIAVSDAVREILNLPASERTIQSQAAPKYIAANFSAEAVKRRFEAVLEQL